MVFSTADALRAALALGSGGLRFRCHVCGRRHLMACAQWEKCARRACRDLSAGWLVCFDDSGRERLDCLEVVPKGCFAVNGRYWHIDRAVLPPVFACALPRGELWRAAREAEEGWWKRARAALDGALTPRPALRRVLQAASAELCRLKATRHRRWRCRVKAEEGQVWLMVRMQDGCATWLVRADTGGLNRTRFSASVWFHDSFAPATPAEFFGLLGLGS